MLSANNRSCTLKEDQHNLSSPRRAQECRIPSSRIDTSQLWKVSGLVLADLDTTIDRIQLDFRATSVTDLAFEPATWSIPGSIDR